MVINDLVWRMNNFFFVIGRTDLTLSFTRVFYLILDFPMYMQFSYNIN